MVFMSKKILFLLLVCWISFEGDADTFVPEVQTLPSVFLEEGVGGKLTCGYDRNVYAVYWRYKSATSPMKLLIVMDRYYQVGEKSGPGYEEGRFDMTDEYSLIIHNVSAKDEGRYMCEVSDLASGDAFRNYTDVTTIVKAERPFPRIGQCQVDVPASAINATCVLHTTSDDPFELTCTVIGAKPMAILSWTSTLASEHWKQAVNGSTLKTKGRGDGIFDQSLSVTVDTSYFTSDAEHFTCVAEGFAVDGIANHTITVYIAPDDMDDMPDKGVNVAVIAVISAGCTLLFIVLIGILWKSNPCRRGGNNSAEADYERVDKQDHNTTGGNNSTEADYEGEGEQDHNTTGGNNSTEADFEGEDEQDHNTTDNTDKLNETAVREFGIETKKKISEIEETTSENDKPLYFGIFGSRNSEILALIDSLVFPFAEMHHREIHEEIPSYRQTRWRQTIKRPSKFIALCEMRDMDCENLEQSLKPISEDKENMRSGYVIHYPIIVSDFGKHEGDHGVSTFEKSLALFSEAVMKSITQYPVLVLTHKNPSEISNRERIISRLNLKTDIPVDNIFVIGSKKIDDSTEEDEILQLLDLLLKCVKNVKGNISPKESKRLEIREEIIRRNPKPIYFGIFGPKEAGKSALIHSLIFAFTGGNYKEIPDAIPAYRDTIQRMSIKRPSKFIALCDMRNTNLKEVGQLLKPLSTDEGSMIKDDVIHYPIVVYECGKHNIYEKSLPQLSEAVKTSISKYPVLVLTHENQSEIPDREEVISRLNSKTNIPLDNIFFTGNSMVDETTQDGDILRLLEILLKCVKNVID